jgi:peptidoglycan/LPS O-acetylase OafA/YrhL
VSITGTAAGSATLTIATTAAVGCTQAYQTPRGVLWYTGGGAALACVLLFGIPARRRRWRLALAMLALLVALLGGLAACGGGLVSPPCTPTPGTTPGAYTITVTGTSGATTATGTVTLTVQ